MTITFRILYTPATTDTVSSPVFSVFYHIIRQMTFKHRKRKCFYNYTSGHCQYRCHKPYNCTSVENDFFNCKTGHLLTLHYSEILYLPRLLTTYRQVTKEYLETVLRCKAAYSIRDWTAFVSIWPADKSKSYMVESPRMTPRVSKRIGVANQ